ncbi:MAG: M14 family metallopeptidase [Thiotrichales bacterium]
MFREIDYLPEGLLNADSAALQGLLGKPTLIHLEGRRKEPLFVSVLLHGNETTGWDAVRQLLLEYESKELPRSLSIFIGNVAAAELGMRRLDGQPDYNRIWPGTDHPPCLETDMARLITETMAMRDVFASVDIHNNTGLNPHYGCINSLEPQFMQLAALFDRLVVFFIRPVGVQSAAFAGHCPSVTLECGKPGQEQGLEHARDFLEACLRISEIPNHPLAAGDVDLYHTVAQVIVNPEFSFGFDDSEHDLRLNPALDHFNFTELEAGAVWGEVLKTKNAPPVLARSEDGDLVTDRYFEVDNGVLRSRRKVMPSMLTMDEKVIAQDCLCYLMERVVL